VVLAWARALQRAREGCARRPAQALASAALSWRSAPGPWPVLGERVRVRVRAAAPVA
jgi:hypothetical protein